MYSIGLERFMQAKKLKSQDTINQFLQSEGITEFTPKNHLKVNNYIQKHWTKFASFVDAGIKSGKLQGKAVKLNYYYDEQRERNEIVKKERDLLTKEENDLYNLMRKYDSGVSFSRTASFFAKKGFNLPKNSDAISKAARSQPKLAFILNSEYYDEYINILKERV